MVQMDTDDLNKKQPYTDPRYRDLLRGVDDVMPHGEGGGGKYVEMRSIYEDGMRTTITCSRPVGCHGSSEAMGQQRTVWIHIRLRLRQ